MHGYVDGRAPGAERLDRLGLSYTVFSAPGTSEDVAMLLAYEKGVIGERYILGGRNLSLAEVLGRVAALRGRRAPRLRLPRRPRLRPWWFRRTR